MSDTTPADAKTAIRFDKPRPKVEPFARFRNTSAWRKDHRRVKEYAAYQASLKIRG